MHVNYLFRTALHWACKRNHPNIIQYLLVNGADTNIKTFKGESPSNLASSTEALNLLGCPLHERMEKLQCEKGEELPIVPHYLQHPPFPYSEMALDEIPDGNLHSGTGNTAVMSTRANIADSNLDTSGYGSAACTIPTSSASLTSSMDTNSCVMEDKVATIEDSRMDTDDPLVLKIRVQNSQETDFLEIELPTPSYRGLLEACAAELEVDVSDVEKIRKLPNVLVCKDRHVQRLTSGQELEVLLK